MSGLVKLLFYKLKNRNMTIDELILKYEKRNQFIDKLTDELDYQLGLVKKEISNKVNTTQINDMEISNMRFNQEWSLNNQFIEELKKLKTII
tara:strand:- start:371 stop:646 length:276 start_codon:yes stop_codon:yes gene_type:complete